LELFTMVKRHLSVMAATALLGCSMAASAATLADLGKVIDVSKFGISVGNSSLFSTQFGIGINGGTPIYLGPANLGTVVGALASAADITLTPKFGSLVPVVTLNKDVNLTIYTLSGLTSTPVADFTFGAGLTWNPDPQITFPISVNNRSATAQNYSFTSPLLLSPVLTPSNSPGTLVKASFTGSLRSNGVGQVDIAPTLGATIVKTTVLDGANTVSLGVDVGNAQSFVAGSNGDIYNYAGQYKPGPSAAGYLAGPSPVTGMTLMTQTVSFSLSAGDRATMVAFSEITPVPEPGSYLLMAVGLLAVAGLARRRGASRT
jgi:hypothetical protein